MLIALLWMMLVHPVHETVTEVEWNAKTLKLEVALRLDVDDEQWIKKRMKGGDDVKVWALQYLRSRLRIADAATANAEDPTTYHWVGRDRDGAHVWWYIEVEPTDQRPPEWIDHRVLFDREPDFLNRVLILGQTPPRALNVTAERSKVRLDEASVTTPGAAKRDSADPDDENNAPLPPAGL